MRERESNSHANSKIGIITYNYFHLKTEQVVHNLLRKGFNNITLFALPFKNRQERAVLIPHRPNQVDSITTEDLAKANNLEFIHFDGKSDLINCDFYLITGAGILSSKVVLNKKIINAHPGIIPSSRGLDSFKWSIYNGIELGITLHFIDENVDSGKIISIIKTPVYEGDSLLTLSRRHYELEIDTLSNFNSHLSNSFIEEFPIHEAQKRMPADVEAVMCRRFDDYKKKYAKRAPKHRD